MGKLNAMEMNIDSVINALELKVDYTFLYDACRRVEFGPECEDSAEDTLRLAVAIDEYFKSVLKEDISSLIWYNTNLHRNLNIKPEESIPDTDKKAYSLFRNTVDQPTWYAFIDTVLYNALCKSYLTDNHCMQLLQRLSSVGNYRDYFVVNVNRLKIMESLFKNSMYGAIVSVCEIMGISGIVSA